MPPGASFTQHIRTAVSAAQVVIAVLSLGLFRSAFCYAELAWAYEAGVNVIPVYSGNQASTAQVDRWIKGELE